MMFGCAYKMLRNHHDAEDATQQVLLKLWLFIDKIRDVDKVKLKSYLYITTKNQCINMLKKEQQNKKDVIYSEEILPLDENTPETVMIEHYDLKILSEAMDKLSPRYRQIILDKTILGLNDEQIAKHIDIKPTYVRECLCRARSSLKNKYLQLLSANIKQ